MSAITHAAAANASISDNSHSAMPPSAARLSAPAAVVTAPAAAPASSQLPAVAASNAAASSASSAVTAALPLETVRLLTLSSDIAGHSGDDAAPFIAAASGLVMSYGRMYIVADDQLSLGVFSAPAPVPSAEAPAQRTTTVETAMDAQRAHGQMHRLIAGALPSDHAARKKQKPDFESLVLLDSAAMPPHGALLAVPSGSAANRTRGSLCRFTNAAGDLDAAVVAVDLRDLYANLSQTFPALNVEGGCVGGGKLTLFQRGNGVPAANGIIDLDLAGVLSDLRQAGDTVRIDPERVQRLVHVDLGKLNGVALGFTDAFRHPQVGTWFLAAAEDTTSTYADGAYVGSVLGRLGDDGGVQLVRPLQCPLKPEGLWLDVPTRSFFAVTDADDPTKPAVLFRGQLPHDETDAKAGER